MNKISHPNVVHQVEFFESKKKIYLIMELLSGGELFDRIVERGSFSEAEAAKVVEQIALALQYLHSQGIVHRDLKPENLVYLTPALNSPVKITDFGLAKLSDPT